MTTDNVYELLKFITNKPTKLLNGIVSFCTCIVYQTQSL